MIYGSFSEFPPLPTVRVLLHCNTMVSCPEFIIDTGFSGDIKVSQHTAIELGIKTLDMTHIGNATGQRIKIGFTYGFAELEGKKKSVEIIVADGPHLLGINFLAAFGYKCVVDCKNWLCHLEFAS